MGFFREPSFVESSIFSADFSQNLVLRKVVLLVKVVLDLLMFKVSKALWCKFLGKLFMYVLYWSLCVLVVRDIVE